MPDAPPDDRWRIDRKVPLTLILALAVQLLAGIWYVASLDARVAQVESWTRDNAGTERRLSVVETKLDGLRELLADRRQAAR